MSDEKRKYLADDTPFGMTRPVVTVLVAMGVVIAYWVWPDGITEVPIEEIPISELIQAAGSVLVAILTLVIALRAWLDLGWRSRINRTRASGTNRGRDPEE